MATSRKRTEADGGFRTESTPDLPDFLAGIVTAFLAIAAPPASPAPGLGAVRLASSGHPVPVSRVFADDADHRQYITTGNLAESDRAFLFLMDYAKSRRVNLQGRAQMTDDAALIARSMPACYKACREHAVAARRAHPEVGRAVDANSLEPPQGSSLDHRSQCMTTRTDRGLTEIVTPLGFEATLARVIDAIADAGLTVFARIDHAQGAAQVGLAMPPTVVLLYGNPRGGTPIMLAAPGAALDLPLRVLVREVETGTSVSLRPIAPMLLAAGVPDHLANALDPAQRLVMEAIRS